MKHYENFIYKLGRKKIERYVWNSTEALEDYLCYLNGWISADGMHGTDAYTTDGKPIEIKTQAFTGRSKKVLSGTFTFSDPSQNVVDRIQEEEIHIFGRDDLSYKIVYHFSISGKEFAPYLQAHLDSNPKNATISWNFNLYKIFKSFKIHDFNKKHLKKYPERWSDELAKVLLGELNFYKKYYKHELKGYELLEVHKDESSKRTKTKFTVRSKKYNLQTTRTIFALKKWNPEAVFVKNITAFHIKLTHNLKPLESYEMLKGRLEEELGKPDGIVSYKTYQKYHRDHRASLEA